MKKSCLYFPECKDKITRFMPNEYRHSMRWEKPLEYVRAELENRARRIDASRKLFPKRFFRGDFHAHSQHSDGIGTVKEMAEISQAAGLDFQFITDHWGLSQGRECKHHRLWVGQEPGTEHHHLGILGLAKTFRPSMNLIKDFKAVKNSGGAPFIPHPTGWWPSKIYEDAQLQALHRIENPFLMEIINGACRIGTAFNYTSESAIKLWDKLLLTGRRIHAMGNTDAHSPHGMGTVWNGVFAPRCDEDSILRAMNRGFSFVSEAPLLWLGCGRTSPGQCIKERPFPPLEIVVVDTAGLMRVRLVVDSQVEQTWLLDEAQVFKQTLAMPAKTKKYVRLEAVSIDGRRAYSNPLYLPTTR